MTIDPHFRTTLMTSAGPAPLAPPGWKNPLRNPDGTVKPLYQLFVERTADGRPEAVSPKMDHGTISDLCAEVNRQIIAGRERQWSNPTVVQVTG